VPSDVQRVIEVPPVVLAIHEGRNVKAMRMRVSLPCLPVFVVRVPAESQSKVAGFSVHL
jgi:hypothetical protein